VSERIPSLQPARKVPVIGFARHTREKPLEGGVPLPQVSSAWPERPTSEPLRSLRESKDGSSGLGNLRQRLGRWPGKYDAVVVAWSEECRRRFPTIV